MTDETQLTLDAFPPTTDVPHARNHDPFTSHISARLAELEEGTTSTLKPRTTKHLALGAIAMKPRTANEVVAATGKRGIWKRVSDLKNAELIQPVGTKLDRETERPCLVWDLTALGARVLGLLDAGETVKL